MVPGIRKSGVLTIKGAMVVVLMLTLSSCVSTSRQNRSGVATAAGQKPENWHEVESAVGAVVGSVSGQEVTSGDLRKLDRQIRTDDETKSAVNVLENSLSGKTSGVKYCPVDGKRYSARLEICPEHKVQLKFLEE